MRRAREAISKLTDAHGGNTRHLAIACVRRELLGGLRHRLQQPSPPPRAPHGGHVAALDHDSDMIDGGGGSGGGGGDDNVGSRGDLDGAEDVDTSEVDCLLLLLQTALELWYTQRALLGPFHPECALSLHEVSAHVCRLSLPLPRVARAERSHSRSEPQSFVPHSQPCPTV